MRTGIGACPYIGYTIYGIDLSVYRNRENKLVVCSIDQILSVSHRIGDIDLVVPRPPLHNAVYFHTRNGFRRQCANQCNQTDCSLFHDMISCFVFTDRQTANQVDRHEQQTGRNHRQAAPLCTGSPGPLASRSPAPRLHPCEKVRGPVCRWRLRP